MSDQNKPKKYLVAALYHFFDFPDFKEHRKPLQAFCDALGIKGTLLIAHEGINGTVAGSEESIRTLLEDLRSEPRLRNLVHKESYAEECPFYRMKVRLKKEIVTLGMPEINPNIKVGTYIKPQDWNSIIQDPEVITIDTRNDYETSIGTFKGATDPDTKTFREFPDYVKSNLDPQKHPKVAMFCTGGIRCEKASSYMLEQGFKEVYHLEGGILKYLEEVPQEQSLWEGECFVFDQRVSVNHELNEGSYKLCYGCQEPLSEEDLASPLYDPGVSCPYCHKKVDEKSRKRRLERRKQIQLFKSRGKNHLGAEMAKH